MIDSYGYDLGPKPACWQHLLQSARAGGDNELGELLEATRRYLLVVANRTLDSQLHPKVAPSDLVQDTFVDAHRDFPRFEGRCEQELFAWLCHILEHKAADAGRKYRGTAKRNIAHEQPLDDGSSRSPLELSAPDLTPSAAALHGESELRLRDALAQLPSDYREVIELRSLQRLSFAEVGLKMARSEAAVGKLWFRAIQKLRDALASPDDSRFSPA